MKFYPACARTVFDRPTDSAGWRIAGIKPAPAALLAGPCRWLRAIRIRFSTPPPVGSAVK